MSAKGQRYGNDITGYTLPEPVLFRSSEFERIIKMEESGNGFVWLATNRGLFCFDGSFFRKIVHSPHDFSAVDAGQINDLYLDNEKEQLWIATEMGASLLDLKTETFSDFAFFQKNKPGWATGECTAVFIDRQGVVWFGVAGFGLISLDTSLHYFPMPRNTSFNQFRDHPTIYQLAQDATTDSILWMAFNQGLARFNTITGKYFVPPRRPPDGTEVSLMLTALFPTKDKIFLGSTWRQQALIYDIKKGTFRDIGRIDPSSCGLPLKLGVFQYRSSTTIWGATDDGLVIIDTRADTLAACYPSFFNTGSESHNFLAMPRRLWMGSTDGLLLYDFNRYTVENHYIATDTRGSPDILFSVVEQEDKNRLLLAFLFSDVIYDYQRINRTYKAIPRHPKSKRWAPVGLMRLDDGRFLAIGDGGIYELRGNQLVYLPLLEELFAAKEALNFCCQDQGSYLWVNSRFAGFYKVDLKTGQYRDCLAGRYFRGTPLVFMDSRENFWLSGEGYSVYKPMSDSLLHFPYQPGQSLTTHFPRDFEEDDRGNIWLSDIRVGGLMMVDMRHLEQGIVKRCAAGGSPQSNQMWALEKDRRGRIWAITQVGLQLFDPKTETFRLFGEEAGFQIYTENINDGFNLSLEQLSLLSSGEMLVGYRHGFAIFHPDSLKENRELPRPYLLSAKANDRVLFGGMSFGSPRPLRLKYDQDVLEFGFSSIAFYEPEKIAYRYRLKGYEAGWKETDRRYIRYTHLPSGRYVFQLLALNSDGLHPNGPLEWHFRILPPWWATWWAYTLYAMIAGALLQAIASWRRRRWQLKTELALEHREAERLKELDTLKTRLYTNITHEFRTPLTVILGMAEQLQAIVQEAGRDKLVAIRRSGSSLLRLVNQMLDLSKLESGAMSIQRVQGDIMPFLRYQLEAFHSLAESKGIRLEFDAEPVSLVGDYDPEKVEAIVTNLLSNALKFTLAGKVQLRVRYAGKNLLIKVLDTGAGINPEAIPFIFDRFYQAETATNRPAEGTGIGLALTKELVKLLGGEVSVESEPGGGTAFTVRLPFEAAPPTSGEATSPTLGGGVVSNAASLKMAPQGFETTPPPYVGDVASKPVLLIVEDNADVVFYLQSLLQNAYRIDVAVDGRSGLAHALEHVPDIILSDVMMPGMDGFELCKILKTDIRTSHIPIILLTARADIASKIEGLQYGADAYLAKPFHKEELFVRLEKLLELRKRLQARYANVGADFPTTPHPTLEDTFMQQIRSILETHLSDEDFGVPELCKALGMSRAQLYRKFQALTDQPVAHYFRDLRLHKAKSLLRDTDLHISEIAFQVGFKDPAHFTRAFAEAFGVSPRGWRKS